MSERESWRRHPLTKKVFEHFTKTFDDNLIKLLQKSAVSTDPEVRGAYERYRANRDVPNFINSIQDPRDLDE